LKVESTSAGAIYFIHGWRVCCIGVGDATMAKWLAKWLLACRNHWYGSWHVRYHRKNGTRIVESRKLNH
jgi:hypothetical protein